MFVTLIIFSIKKIEANHFSTKWAKWLRSGDIAEDAPEGPGILKNRYCPAPAQSGQLAEGGEGRCGLEPRVVPGPGAAHRSIRVRRYCPTDVPEFKSSQDPASGYCSKVTRQPISLEPHSPPPPTKLVSLPGIGLAPSHLCMYSPSIWDAPPLPPGTLLPVEANPECAFRDTPINKCGREIARSCPAPRVPGSREQLPTRPGLRSPLPAQFWADRLQP